MQILLSHFKKIFDNPHVSYEFSPLPKLLNAIKCISYGHGILKKSIPSMLNILNVVTIT